MATYTELDRKMEGKDATVLAPNTFVTRDNDHKLSVFLYSTRILSFEYGTVSVFTGGRHTTLTISRINSLLPSGIRIYRRGGALRFDNGMEEGKFYEGITFRTVEA